MIDTYKTIKAPSEGYFREKGSKFLAFAWPVSNENEIKEILSKLRKEHHSARHHCYAWQLGVEDIYHRANDDGEPSSSAGKPILGQLNSFELTNILVVVVRYFGGKLLGVSGLINAYRSATSDALKNAKIITRVIEKKLQINFAYKEMNDVMHIIKQENFNVLETTFDESCSLKFSVRKSDAVRIEELFANIHTITITNID